MGSAADMQQHARQLRTQHAGSLADASLWASAGGASDILMCGQENREMHQFEECRGKAQIQ